MQKAKFSIDSILSAKISDCNSDEQPTKIWNEYPNSSSPYQTFMMENVVDVKTDSILQDFNNPDNIQCMCTICKNYAEQKRSRNPHFIDKKAARVSHFNEKTKFRQLNDDNYGLSKRRRTIFSAEQLERLEYEFQQQQYLVGEERKYLARELQLNEVQIKVWYQNRRIKWRKFVKPFYETPSFS